MPSNRRTSTRHQVNLPVSVALGAVELDSRMENLSLGGAFVACTERVCIGQQLALVFDLPGRSESMRVDALVRWSDDSGMGVQFGSLRAGEIWALNEFLKQLVH